MRVALSILRSHLPSPPCSTEGGSRVPSYTTFLKGWSGIHISAPDLLWNLPPTDLQTLYSLRTQSPNTARAHSFTAQTILSVPGRLVPRDRGSLGPFPPPAPAPLCWKSREQKQLCQLYIPSPGAPASSVHRSPPFRGQQPAGWGADSQTGLPRPPTARWHRPAHEMPPITAPSLPPSPTRFSKKECVWSGPDDASPETRRTDLSRTRLSGHCLAPCRL